MKKEVEPEGGRYRRRVAAATRLIISTGLEIQSKVLAIPPEPDLRGEDILAEPPTPPIDNGSNVVDI